jgi:type I restriction enzyme, S subunit
LRPYLNKVLLADRDGFCTTEIVPIKPNEVLDGRYLLYWLKSPQFLEYVDEVSRGVNMPRLTTDAGIKAPLVLAPLNEQKRIAETLEQQLEQVNSSITQLNEALEQVKRFRQGTLTSAIDGTLTEEWRKENNITKTWESVVLNDVASSRLGKMLDQAKNQVELVPYLRNINVRWFEFNLADIHTMRVNAKELQGLYVLKEDVLICEGGEPGRCAIWRGDENTYIYQKALHRVRVHENLTPEWLCYCLKVAADVGELEEIFTGSTIKHLTGVALGQFRFALPSRLEQLEIIRRVQELFTTVDTLEAQYLETRNQLEQAIPKLLEKAFRGELVPRDPSDEPASVLLERIRLARETAALTYEKPVRLKPSPEEIKSRKLEVNMLQRKDIKPSHLTDILKAQPQSNLSAESLWEASKLEIDDFYGQLKDEEAQGLLQELWTLESKKLRVLAAVL